MPVSDTSGRPNFPTLRSALEPFTLFCALGSPVREWGPSRNACSRFHSIGSFRSRFSTERALSSLPEVRWFMAANTILSLERITANVLVHEGTLYPRVRTPRGIQLHSLKFSDSQSGWRWQLLSWKLSVWRPSESRDSRVIMSRAGPSELNRGRGRPACFYNTITYNRPWRSINKHVGQWNWSAMLECNSAPTARHSPLTLIMPTFSKYLEACLELPSQQQNGAMGVQSLGRSPDESGAGHDEITFASANSTPARFEESGFR